MLPYNPLAHLTEIKMLTDHTDDASALFFLGNSLYTWVSESLCHLFQKRAKLLGRIRGCANRRLAKQYCKASEQGRKNE